MKLFHDLSVCCRHIDCAKVYDNESGVGRCELTPRHAFMRMHDRFQAILCKQCLIADTSDLHAPSQHNLNKTTEKVLFAKQERLWGKKCSDC